MHTIVDTKEASVQRQQLAQTEDAQEAVVSFQQALNCIELPRLIKCSGMLAWGVHLSTVATDIITRMGCQQKNARAGKL